MTASAATTAVTSRTEISSKCSQYSSRKATENMPTLKRANEIEPANWGIEFHNARTSTTTSSTAATIPGRSHNENRCVNERSRTLSSMITYTMNTITAPT